MTRKSASRRDADRKRAEQNGGKKVVARVNREKSSRAWYELNIVHARSQAYIQRLAEHMRKYVNPPVHLKIASNGDAPAWKELNASLNTNSEAFAKRFADLYDSHKDKKKLCLSLVELEQAMAIHNEYEKFDTDFFTTFQPIISGMNEIFNKALKQLLDAQDELAKKMAEAGQQQQAAVAIDPLSSDSPLYADVPSGPFAHDVALDMEVPKTIAVDAENISVKAAGLKVHFDETPTPPVTEKLQELATTFGVNTNTMQPAEVLATQRAAEIADNTTTFILVDESVNPQPSDQAQADQPLYSINAIDSVVNPTTSSAPDVLTPLSAEDLSIDPNLRAGLIRPNI